MSQLRLETIIMPAADLGDENPLPPIQGGGDLHAIAATSAIPDEMVQNMALGHLPNVMPYTMQDGYTRHRQDREFKTAVLENDILKATFLLELGGRLWSLLHKPSGRELLAKNNVFQPANLGLRNAWFSGGVEWNIGTIGHSPFTCAPLFAAKVEADDGTPILRMYEYERFRGTPFQIDAYLPADSPVLFVRVSIHNSTAKELPIYWWSNIAVPETAQTRVIVPTDKAFRFGYKGSGLMRIDTPSYEAQDYTYSVNIDHSADYFFDIPQGQRPYIAAFDKTGSGLVQTSTARLQGRKLFLWGKGAGGGQWQKFLSPSGCNYIEIQAGLARTQMEHLPMPAFETWSWLEAYGLVAAPATAVHGEDWSAAQTAVQHSLDTLVPEETLQAEYERSSAFAQKEPTEIWQQGSGWGALEQQRRQYSGEPSLAPAGLIFGDASLTAVQKPWLSLLQSGIFPPMPPTQAPLGYMVQAEWRDLLETAVSQPESNHWFSWYHLGIMRHYAGEQQLACAAWEQAVQATPTAWSFRVMAITAQANEQYEDAAALMAQAVQLVPDLLPLLIEYGRILIQANHADSWLAHLATLPDDLKNAGRIRLLEAQAALQLGDFARVAQFFQDEIVVPDIREGEVTLSDLWFAYHLQRIATTENCSVTPSLKNRIRREFPLPLSMDFRMTRDNECSP